MKNEERRKKEEKKEEIKRKEEEIKENTSNHYRISASVFKTILRIFESFNSSVCNNRHTKMFTERIICYQC